MSNTVSVQNLAVVAVSAAAVYVRLPQALQRPTDGCECPYCVAHPDHTPTWDTLAVPTDGGTTWTVHMPDGAATQAAFDRLGLGRA